MLFNYPESHFIDPTEQCIYRIDLHDTSGGRDAVYIIRAVKQDTGEYVVITYWGRSGKSLSNKILYTSAKATTAQELADYATDAINATKGQAINKINSKTSNYQKVDEQAYAYNSAPQKERALPSAVDLPLWHYFEKDAATNTSPAFLSPMYLANDYVVEPVGTLDEWVFLMIENGNWEIYNNRKRKFATIPAAPDIAKNMEPYNGYVFAGKTIGSSYAVFDIIDAETYVKTVQYTLENIKDKPWFIRRTMLTEVFSNIYPVGDLYFGKRVILNDYADNQSEKERMYREHDPNVDGMLAVRGINDKYYAGISVKVV